MKPILFSTSMTQAIQNDRKTQTRRVIKPQPPEWCNKFGFTMFTPKGSISARGDSPQGYAERFIKLRYQPGDILWVRETWKCIKYNSMDGNLGYGVEFKDGTRIYFEFEDSERFHRFGKYATKNGWQPSIFMPKEAARLFLLVENARIERVQELTEEDAMAEGFTGEVSSIKGESGESLKFFTSREDFAEYWDSLNAKRGYPWESNPWVEVTEFKKISKEEAYA